MTVTYMDMGARFVQPKFRPGPTGQSGPPFEVDQFFIKLFRLDRTDPLTFGPKNFRKFWSNGPRPQRTSSLRMNVFKTTFTNRRYDKTFLRAQIQRAADARGGGVLLSHTLF